jgi:hypothetical protein
MNDIAPFKPKRMALEPATDPNPDIVFRFFLWLLDFEFLRVMVDNLLLLNLESRLSGLAFSLIGMWGVEMGQTKEHDVGNYGLEQLPARLIQFASSAIECPAIGL